MGLAWSGVLAVEGLETGDDRIFDRGALTWENLPLPLRWCPEDFGEHGGAKQVGWISEVSRSGDQILGSGDIFDDQFAEFLNRAGQIGVSIDPDSIEYSIEIAPEAAAPSATPEGLAAEGGTVEIPEELMVIHAGRLRAATCVDIPAFIDAVIKPGLPAPVAAPEAEAPSAAAALLQQQMANMAAVTAEFAPADEQPPPVPTDEPADPPPATPPGPTHAGLVVAALDTGRILMLQRVLDPEDPASGTWEFPGGSIDPEDSSPYDGAKREFSEETGLPAPDGDAEATWMSADGIYQAFVKAVPVEAEAFSELNPDIAAAEAINPDDPNRELPEVTAWMDPATLDGWKGLRTEVQGCLPDLDAALTAIAGAAEAGVDAIVASFGGPVAPPAEWFEPFDLEGPTPFTVTEDGRLYGHLALKASCHADFADACVTPPSDPDPEFFHLGTVLTAEGTTVAVGRVTVGGGHAVTRGPRSQTSLQAALEHYDNTSTCAGVVRAHEDAYGIALFGAVVPEATQEQIASLRRSPLSADWRKAGGRFRLVAAHAVNTPGYPVLRGALVAASGGPESMVVTGRVTLQRNVVDLRSARERIARSIGRDKQSRRAELTARVHGQTGD